MDSTINKFIVGFMILVIFDATSFSIQKQKFGMLSSVVNTVSTVRSTIGAFK